MALFRRGPRQSPTAPDVASLMLQGADAIDQTGQAHAERWGLRTADAWSIDQESGLIRWTFGDRTVEAPVQVLGSYGLGGTWSWAWANESLLPSIRTTS